LKVFVKPTRIIKKYANRRLYDTEASKHVTLSNIRQMIIDGADIQIIEDTTGDDITRPLLLQIIVEQEQSGGQPILTELLLAQLIRFYGNPMQGMMAEYLQKSVSTFLNQQRTVQSQMQDLLSNTPLDTMRELTAQNLKTWESLFKAGISGKQGEAGDKHQGDKDKE
jgi:polyhydroxyalkanoate synthesis repressor PhaR